MFQSDIGIGGPPAKDPNLRALTSRLSLVPECNCDSLNEVIKANAEISIPHRICGDVISELKEHLRHVFGVSVAIASACTSNATSNAIP